MQEAQKPTVVFVKGHTLPETNMTSPLKMGCLEYDGPASYWGISAYFQGPTGHVSFRGQVFVDGLLKSAQKGTQSHQPDEKKSQAKFSRKEWDKVPTWNVLEGFKKIIKDLHVMQFFFHQKDTWQFPIFSE